jgi:citronellol/citronellal dehydrogenase
MADAAHAVLCRRADEVNGRFLIDEEVLREQGTRDFSIYAVQPGHPLTIDLFLDQSGD